MNNNKKNNPNNLYGAAVIGGGHAGIEAALASARMGVKTIIFTLSLDAIGNMPCNPSIGGTGKGHLVFEINALGGEMAKIADETVIQRRMLNMSKGPAVHSLRFQSDREEYRTAMKQTLENQKNLDIYQAEITEIIFEDISDDANKKTAKGVKTRAGEIFYARTVIIACGTYLESNIIIGDVSIESGPDNMARSSYLSENLKRNGIDMRRFKTGTPARIHSDSINYSVLEVQNGDDEIINFSDRTDNNINNINHKKSQRVCYITYTNEETHKIIRENLHRSPMYSGQIKGTGARYCPSIEDKVVRFADKNRHQIFIEPMGNSTKETYLQGLSTSMPIDIQKKIINSMQGLENAEIMRPAYAIEYECCDPLQLRRTLEFKDIENLFGAGQFNGTSGYEEAAAQGLVAGINAALKVLGKPEFTLDRASSYIGMLIDDLVTKGTNEPYRVMTSRTEYRVSLRQDNADERLMRRGFELGLISPERFGKLQTKLELINQEIIRVKNKTVYPSEQTNKILRANGTPEINVSVKLIDLLKRPELNYNKLKEIDTGRPENIPENIFKLAAIKILYDGYIKREQSEITRHKKLEGRKIPRNLDYSSLKGLRIEALQKLDKTRPENIGEASRISGISPADITALIINLDKRQ
ncbi:MAG: tRNA uridine-5-carboxymethylaminomethyl(34) synthesis enzyme MnmG [Oscillospiraceae bacterium]|nr:tRNA uridine-5-carboxymethylaminomethyl(34) synthesis enzyme MnmG [Oscillospiraceae bacterium]